MIEIGKTVTVINDHVTIDGNINLQSGQQMTVRDLQTIGGNWSGDYWIPEKIIGVLLEDHYGIYSPDCFYENNIGKRVCKCSISKKEPNNKPFKSGLKINTIKGVINHPHLNKPAYVFEEDDSYVECRRCMIVYYSEYQKELINLSKKSNKIIITAEQGIGKSKS